MICRGICLPQQSPSFTHQLAAWEILNRPEPQSLVVTSGTGSGKTECFLVPVLNQLAKAIDAGEDPEGVRALFIYPLNALINSRRTAWMPGQTASAGRFATACTPARWRMSARRPTSSTGSGDRPQACAPARRNCW